MFRAAADRAGLRLDTDCEPLNVKTFVDREMWAKILSNLLSNALKFTFEGGITVSVRQLEGDDSSAWVELRVSDTGVGISEADRAHLFERFYRVEEASSRSFEGSGIGLALVAELVSLHGGHIEARSVLNQGSTFIVQLPAGDGGPGGADAPSNGEVDAAQFEEITSGLVREAMRWLDSEEDGRRDGQPEKDVVAPAATRKPRILIADDNGDMRRYMAALLENSYQLDMAPDGAVALRLARVTPPDLVLTDVMMPNLDGFGLLSALRADPTHGACTGHHGFRQSRRRCGRGGIGRRSRRLPRQTVFGAGAPGSRPFDPRARATAAGNRCTGEQDRRRAATQPRTRGRVSV